MTEKLKPYTHAELIKFYLDGESADSEIFSEMRSNVLLVSGEHYNRKRLNVARRIQDFKDLSDQQKIRITKNHIQKICQIYEDHILETAPGVGFEPKNKNELQDQKSAELHHAVWLDAEDRIDWKEEEEAYVEDFIEIGEVAAKVFYDPTEGDIVGHYATKDEEGNDTEEPDLSRPVFKGMTVIENVEAYNLVRPSECKNIKKAEWLAIKKMVPKDKLMAKFQDEAQRKFITTSSDQTYTVFDSGMGGYRKTEKECFMIEMYFRESPRYPQGQYVFMTREGILTQGELPGGIFPLEVQPCNRIHGSARGRSPIKTMRPFQVEINRCASKIAEHHITVGDDKLILLNGAKASSGMAMPGVRTVNVTGAAPTVLSGRDGGQFVSVAESNVQELYMVMGIPEDPKENSSGATDPYQMLFRSAKQKRIHSRRIRRFSNFKRRVVQKYLSIQKLYIEEDDFIKAVGRNEAINISEFKNSNDSCYEVRVSDQSDDVETKLGQQIMLTTALQYVGNKLTAEQIGMFMRMMPYANGEQAFSDMTMNFDAAVNDILALDRGEKPPVHPADDHVYMAKRLTKRTREPDFRFLSPEIQQNYQDKINIHDQFEAYNQLQQQRAEQGLIPTSGYLVVCDLYVPDPKDPLKTQRVRLPSDAVEWLIKVLETQGTMISRLDGAPDSVKTDIANKVMAGGAPQNPAQMSNQPQAHAQPPMNGGMPPAQHAFAR